MDKYLAKAIVGTIGFIVIGMACYWTSSGTPLWGICALVWLLHDGIN